MSFWENVRHKTAVRNDFMSHGAYITLIVMLGMVSGLREVDTTWVLAVIGIIIGAFSSIIRELYDHGWGPGWEWEDILAGACGTVFAVLCMIALRGGI